MKACVLTDWNHLEMQDVPVPEIKEGQVLLKTIYAGICGSDVTVSRHKHPTATVPRILGHEILGRVAETRGETGLQVGDRCVVHPLSHCGVCEACREGQFHVCRHLGIKGLHSNGGFAEYVAADADVTFRVPDDVPDEVAILTEPFAVGFHAHMRAGTRAGDKVLIIGGGPIGIIAAMAATYFGAGRVVVSEINPVRLELIRSLGFETINPKEEDQGEAVRALTDGAGFDRVIEASGSAAGAAFVHEAARISGTVALVGIPTAPVALNTVQLILKEITVRGCRVYSRDHFKRSLEMLTNFYRTGRFDLDKMIDRFLELDQLAEGIEMQANGVNNAKIVVNVGKH